MGTKIQGLSGRSPLLASIGHYAFQKALQWSFPSEWPITR